MKVKLAVFDVDGTLFDGNLGIEFLKVLVKEKVFPEDLGKKIYDWYTKYKNGDAEKGVAVDECYKLYALGMKGLESIEINKWALITWNMIKNNMFGFVKETVKKLISNNFKIILISGSPIEMVKELARELNIPISCVCAGKLVIKKGKYTGERLTYPAWAEQKIKALNELIDSNRWNVDWKNSLAMGDNERDAGILSLVDKPIAFKPNKELKEIAIKKGWRVVEEETTFFLY